MEYCEVCGNTLKGHVEVGEAWGRPYKEIVWECVNINCGEEEEDD